MLWRILLIERPFMKALILLSSLLTAIFGIASPYFMKVFIDRILGIPSSLELKWVAEFSFSLLVFVIFATVVFSQLFTILTFFLATRESILAQKRMSEKIYDQILLLRSENYHSRTTGEIVSIYATDVPAAAMLVEQTIPMGLLVVGPVVLTPFVISKMFHIPLFSLILTMAIIVIVNAILAYRQAKFFKNFKELAAERTGIVNEWIQNIRALRILDWVRFYENKIFNKRIEETINRVQMVTNGQTMGSIATTVTFILNAIVMFTFITYSQDLINPGNIFALLWILGVFLARPFRQLPWLFTFAMDARTSIVRIQSFLKLKNKDIKIHHPAHKKNTAISIKNLTLVSNQQLILDDISVDIQKGEFITIVGEIGSGKSTFLHSLLLENSATFDEYSLLGKSVKSMQPQDVRNTFSYVPQEAFVMTSLLKDNVIFEYDTLESQTEPAVNSLNFAQIDLKQDIFANGIHTEIGEKGVNLSGGQKQRLNIARAHYFKRPILLLDDCFSAIDAETEKKLIKSLFKDAWKEQTKILVTHRLSVLSHSDRVFYFENGKIAAQGSLQELLKESTSFQQFVESSLNKLKGGEDHEKNSPLPR